MNTQPILGQAHVRAPVWVMQDRHAPAEAAGAIAGRLGVPFRRIGSDGPAGRVAPGSVPRLILSSGWRAAAWALLFKARHGTPVVHCRQLPGRLGRSLAGPFDLLVLPAYSRLSVTAALASGRVLPTLGLPQPVSPALLAHARLLWTERLSHLPFPRLCVLLGGGGPGPRAALALARQLTAMARLRDGCVLACALPDCPADTADAFASGLAGGMHLLHRAGEPGADPTLGFLGGSDAILVAWAGDRSVSEACAADGPVFVLPRDDRPIGALTRHLLELDQVRRWGGGTDWLTPWPRPPLDEAGRVAQAILRRYTGLADRSLEPDRSGRA